MARKKKQVDRNVALCYIRLSYTRNENDSDSPERQRSNIQKVCDSKGWTPEWYQDTGGHKSGRSENNRPSWLKLKTRLDDPDVVALVVNDRSRTHRRSWRFGELIDNLTELGVEFVTAAPGRDQIDTTTPSGRMMAQIGAMFDELYAEDISKRAKDSVAYRKSRGISIGMPPFGTERNDDGYLIPTQKGAWLLPDGTFEGADDNTNPPVHGAIWRSYFDCARHVLEIYSKNESGMVKIAYKLAGDGWCFRDRKGNPRPINRADIRRIVANNLEYGGSVSDQKAKDRRVWDATYDVDDLPFNSTRAVFSVELLKKVEQIRLKRTLKPVDNGIKRKDFPYPLSQITFCSHCDELAKKSQNMDLRSSLGGTNMNGTRRYRHKFGVKCGCTNKSVTCDILEDEFTKLIRLIEVKPDAVDLMHQFAIEADNTNSKTRQNMEVEKQEKIVLATQRIKNTVVLFGDGMITEDQYRRQIRENEKEIAYWEAITTEAQRVAVELTKTLNVVNQFSYIWENSKPQDRKGIARHLFKEIVFNLDTQRIVGFQFQDWAERFLVVRAAMLDAENAESDTTQGVKQAMPHRRLELLF